MCYKPIPKYHLILHACSMLTLPLIFVYAIEFLFFLMKHIWGKKCKWVSLAVQMSQNGAGAMQCGGAQTARKVWISTEVCSRCRGSAFSQDVISSTHSFRSVASFCRIRAAPYVPEPHVQRGREGGEKAETGSVSGWIFQCAAFHW